MKKHIFFIAYVFMFLCIITVSYASTVFNSDMEDTKANIDTFMYYNNDWTLEYANGSSTTVATPVKLKDIKGATVIIHKTLDEDLSIYNMLLIQDLHTSVSVYIDDELIYSYGTAYNKYFPAPGKLWLRIDLLEEYEGRELSIVEIAPVEKYAGRIGNIILTDEASAITFLIGDNLLGSITCLILLVTSLILFVAWIATKRYINNNRILHLALVGVVVLCWSATETVIPQLITNNMRTVGYMATEFLILIPLPVGAYFSNYDNKYIKNLAYIILVTTTITFILCNALHFTHVMDMTESIILSHANIVISALCLLGGYIMMIKYRRLNNSTPFRVGMIGYIFLVSLLLTDMFHYYKYFYSDNALYSRIGFLIFVVALCIDTIVDNFHIMLLGKKAEMYKDLAYTDVLTGSYNRTAYEEKIVDLDNNAEAREGSIVLAIDINNLKTINDTEGHEKGDLYIIDNIDYLKSIFGNIGDCYRTGGDEFVFLFTARDNTEFKKRIKTLDKNMSSFNSERINFAYGYSSFSSATDSSMADVIKRADNFMYEKKRNMKGENESIR